MRGKTSSGFLVSEANLWSGFSTGSEVIRGLLESSVMFSAPAETLDTKESRLIPRLNV